MPRTLTLTAMRAALAQETDEVYLVLLKVEHASFSGPMYFVNNTQDIVSDGDTYKAFPFQAVLPSDEDEREPVAQLVISNVDQTIIDDIRAITSGAPTVKLSVVVASQPNTMQYGPVLMRCKTCDYDARSITFTLGFDPFAGEPLGWIRLTPEFFPGMFA